MTNIAELVEWDCAAWSQKGELPHVARQRRALIQSGNRYDTTAEANGAALRDALVNAGWPPNTLQGLSVLLYGAGESLRKVLGGCDLVQFDRFSTVPSEPEGVQIVQSLPEIVERCSTELDLLIIWDELELASWPDRLFDFLFARLQLGGRFLLRCRAVDRKGVIPPDIAGIVCAPVAIGELQCWVRSRSNNFGLQEGQDLAGGSARKILAWGVKTRNGIAR